MSVSVKAFAILVALPTHLTLEVFPVSVYRHMPLEELLRSESSAAHETLEWSLTIHFY